MNGCVVKRWFQLVETTTAALMKVSIHAWFLLNLDIISKLRIRICYVVNASVEADRAV